MFLDGEIYKHGLNLQQINKKVRNSQEDASDLKLVIFDTATITGAGKPFSLRLGDLEALKLVIAENGLDALEIAPTVEC